MSMPRSRNNSALELESESENERAGYSLRPLPVGFVSGGQEEFQHLGSPLLHRETYGGVHTPSTPHTGPSISDSDNTSSRYASYYSVTRAHVTPQKSDALEPLFSRAEATAIEEFFGASFLASVKKLDIFFVQQEKAEDEWVGISALMDQEDTARETFTALVQALKRTPEGNMEADEAGKDPAVLAIWLAAKNLEEKLKLTDRWQEVGKWVLQIIGALIGILLGAGVGFTVGALAGGGAFSVPCSVVGALIGGGLGFWAGKKVSHRNPDIANADHSKAIRETVEIVADKSELIKSNQARCL